MTHSPRRPFRIACLMVAAGLLGACQTPAAAPSMPCTQVALGLQSQIGRPVSGIDATGPAGRRVLGPDDAATMDFVPGRLNLSVDGAGDLTRAYCG